MNLSSDLISQFVKVTNDKTEKKSESSNLGTVVIYNNTKYVKLDGSDLLTPVKTTTSVSDGDRVTVTIKDHSATVTGNLSDPSASGNTVTEIGKQISEFEIIIADKVSTEELEAEIARIDELVSDNVTIKDTLTANKAIIEDLQAENATITGKLTADEAEIENLKTTKLDASVADITYATITDLEATNANIYNLEATYGDFEVLTTNKFTAIDATIKDLEADKLSATDAELKYANIDFANIGQAAIENFLSKSGMIGDLVVGDGTVTGTLIGVTIKGDLIEGNTIVADKLVIKGDDGLYYKLNTDGETVEAAQTEYNSLNGSVIIAKSVTASKIRVDDLVAFDATIGGFNITENSIYSGVKESVSNTTRGVYLDDDGQVAFGDASNFLKYYKDQNGDYRLEISAKTMVLGSSSKNVETEITNLQKATITGVDVLYAMSTSTTEAPTSGWSTTAPEWTDGMYMWQKTVITYGDGSTEESAITCISGATGATGESGNDGGTGSDGKGISTIIEQYYQSSSAIDLIGGSWSSTSPTWKDGYYVWTRTVITYDDNTSVTTSPICITGSKGETGAAGKDGNDGVSVTSVDVYYYVSTSNTTLTGGSWSTDAPTWTDGSYIWSKTVTSYSDSTTTESEPACITGGKGATGATGESGSDGNGVSSIVEQYYQSSSSTSLTGGTWSTTYPGWKDGYYIWTRSVITYTDKSSVTTTAVCVTGSKGETGATGKGVSKSEVYYYLSTSNTTQTGGSWSTTVPTWKDGYYYWQKIITTYTDSTTSESTPVCITGAKGSTGAAGSDGSDGVGVESIVEEYYQSSSSTSQNGGSWSTTVPTWKDGYYIWTRSVITYTDKSSVTTTPVCVTGAKGSTGATGATGVGVKTITNYYLATSSSSGVTTSTSGWTTSVQSVTSSKKYLWNYELVSYTDSSTTSTDPCIIGAYGDTGATGSTGATGATGNGIKSIVEYYAVSTSNSTTPSSWSTTVPTLTSTNKYLWNYETITYTDGSSSDTTKKVIGVYGDKGATGSTGVGISKVTEYYAVSSSNSTAPTTWDTTVPTLTSTNKYLWNYEVTTLTNNSTLETSKRVIGVYGNTGSTGSTGATGVGIKSITNYYLASASSSGVTTSTDGWTTSIQTITTSKKYLWNYEIITYTDSTTNTTTPVIIGAYGNTGATGATGVGVKSITNYYLATSSSSGVTTSTSGWTTAVQSVSSSKKYLWNYELVTYTDSSTTLTDPCVIGAYGDTGAKGSTGATGATGNGIKSIVEYYAVSTSNTTTPSSWSTTVPTLTSTNKYLWNYETITYTNGTSTDTTKKVIGVYGNTGATGATGATGVGVSGVTEYYAVSASNSTAPTSWSTTVPTMTTTNKYLWNYEVTTLTNNTTLETNKRVIGVYGNTGSTGATGATGVGIKTVTNYYLASASSSGVTTSTSGWTTTIQTISSSKKYLWNYEVITYTNSSTTTTTPVIIGAYGNTGATGKGISSVVEYYAVSSSNSTVPSSWSKTVPTMTTTNKYLWNYEVTTYTDSTTSSTSKRVIGVYGNTGSTGATGKGVKSITNYYLVTSSSSGVTTSTSGWSTTPSATTTTNKYLWNYEIITYTDSTTATTTPHIIGTHGATGATGAAGATGATGVGVKSVDVYYYLSSSSTALSGGSWSTTAPTWVNGKYMWSKTITTFTDSKTSESEAVCITGAKGATGSTGSTGATGDDGVGVSSIITQFYLSTSKTTQTGGSWVTTMPTWSTGKYLWTRSLITYTDGTTATTSPICDSSWEAVNEVEVGGRNYIKGGKGDSDSGIFKNFDTINIDECYAEHTLTSQKTYANVNIASGFVLGCRDYEVGSQVTWSYDIMFTAWDFPDGATRSEWWFGQRYTKDSTDSTNTTGAWRGVTMHTLPVIGSNGCELNEWYHVEKTITIPEQAADGIDTAGCIQFYNSNADVSASVTFRLKNVKLEYGNKATDWTPAIEDVDDDISNAQSSADEANNKADSNTTRITEAETLIAKLEDCIAMMVTDENGMSLMTQTDTGWTFNIAELQDAVDSASSGLDTLKNSLGSTDATVDALQQAVSDLEETAEYVRITTYEDEPCIELGEGDSDFKLLITNTRIMFMNGSDIPTYISNTGLVTKNIEVEDELVFGNWAWKVRSNGNLGLVWKG